MPPVSAISGALDDLGHLCRAGEHHAGNAGLAHQRGADGFSGTVQQLQRVARHARLVQQLHCFLGDRGRLLGRLRQNGVAGDERGGNLPGEDGEREVPGTDAHPGAARRQAQLVAFAGGARQREGLHDALRLVGVVAQEIDGFTYLRHAVAPGLEPFLHEQRAQPGHLGLHRIGRVA